MGSLFSPKVPKTPPPPKPVQAPTVDEAKIASEAGDRLRRRRGRAANILTGSDGDTSSPTTGSTALLGS